VAIARALVNEPRLLLADEPTGNLDPDTSLGIAEILSRINVRGTTVVVATHDKHMVDHVARRVIEIGHGRVVRDEMVGQYHGPPADAPPVNSAPDSVA
jgi:cell division transport system ATP-binding protein